MSAASGRQSKASIHASYTRSEYFILPETKYIMYNSVRRVQQKGVAVLIGVPRVPINVVLLLMFILFKQF